jgi:hypothetical protein
MKFYLWVDINWNYLWFTYYLDSRTHVHECEIVLCGVFCVCVCVQNLILNVRIPKIMDIPLHLIDIHVCHYSKQPHCCHIGYACAGPCHEAFVFCNFTIPCHIWCASTMSTRTYSLITQVFNFFVTISSALGSGHYLVDPTVKMSNIFLCSPERLATINFEVQLNQFS